MNQSTSMHKAIPQKQVKGFTLIEVIVVMVVIGILAGIAIPSFRGFTRSSQVTSAANDLVSALNLARSEAVSRAIPVTVCKSDDQATCDNTLDWHDGWIVFVDADNDGVVAAVGDILRVYSAPGGVTMTGGSNRMSYAATGFFSADFSGTIQVISGTRQVDIISSVNGRVSSEVQ